LHKRKNFQKILATQKKILRNFPNAEKNFRIFFPTQLCLQKCKNRKLRIGQISKNKVHFSVFTFSSPRPEKIFTEKILGNFLKAKKNFKKSGSSEKNLKKKFRIIKFF